MTSLISAILLAGGKSSRMGFDKRFARWGELTFLENGIEILRPIADELVISIRVGESALIPKTAAKWIPDQENYAGPLKSLHHTLSHCSHEVCVVIPCDMPKLATTTIQLLVKRLTLCGASVAICDSGPKIQPLPCAFRKSHYVAALEKYLAQGHCKLTGLLSMPSMQVVKVPPSSNTTDTWLEQLENFNTPESLIP